MPGKIENGGSNELNFTKKHAKHMRHFEQLPSFGMTNRAHGLKVKSYLKQYTYYKYCLK